MVSEEKNCINYGIIKCLKSVIKVSKQEKLEKEPHTQKQQKTNKMLLFNLRQANFFYQNA